jgi:hypothetical protein
MNEISTKPIFIKKIKDNKNIKNLFPRIKNRKYILVNKSGIENIIIQEEAIEIHKIINKYVNSKESILSISNTGIGSIIIYMYDNFKYIYGYEQNKLQYDMMFHNCNLYEIQNMKLFNSDYDNKHGTDIVIIDKINITDTIITNSIENIKCTLLLFRLPKNYNLSIFDKYRHKVFNILEHIIIAIKQLNT